MLEKRTFIAALMATTFLTAGVAFAAEQQATPTSPQQTTLDKDAITLSADGAHAYNDLALTRLAIYDGRTADAKKLIDEADTAFSKAKSDDSVFTKAEADLKTPDATAGTDMANAVDRGADKTDPHAAQATSDAAKKETSDAAKKDMTTPKRWLPIDADMSVDEDFTANPAKAAAVADANKSLDKGDTKGAMAKLKLADVSMTYVMAVVPLDQTLADVHQAAQLIDGGKYYEGSQLLRQVQDSARYDVIVASDAPGKAAANGKSANADDAKKAATH